MPLIAREMRPGIRPEAKRVLFIFPPENLVLKIPVETTPEGA
ncbi:hypothetical protein HMPREF0294_0196 [Corynebacterium glucuronolyticum ATCC 51867]|nr:hypothetical protein HMPREF0294_0196 [Corynebacterium glucuronolyticum ATCC 51867]